MYNRAQLSVFSLFQILKLPSSKAFSKVLFTLHVYFFASHFILQCISGNILIFSIFSLIFSAMNLLVMFTVVQVFWIKVLKYRKIRYMCVYLHGISSSFTSVLLTYELSDQEVFGYLQLIWNTKSWISDKVTWWWISSCERNNYLKKKAINMLSHLMKNLKITGTTVYMYILTIYVQPTLPHQLCS